MPRNGAAAARNGTDGRGEWANDPVEWANADADAGARPTVLPFSGLNDPESLALDAAGDVYVVDYAGGSHVARGHVVKLAAGSNAQTVLPFTGLNLPTGVAVDTAGDLYVVDRNNGRVVKLAAGSNTQTVLPVTGASLAGVAVDTAGTVYVSDQNTQRVVELPAG